jgi:beta-carotene 3-hydroxylase
VSAALSEPAAALTHRVVMHRRRGWRWHRSHHAPRHTRWEDNDRFPLAFAGLTILTMATGHALARPRLIAAGAGVTLYGALYLVVHDVAVHGRISGGRPLLPGPWLRWVSERHAVHHRTGTAPYGFLAPIDLPRYHAAVASLRGADTRARRANTS